MYAVFQVFQAVLIGVVVIVFFTKILTPLDGRRWFDLSRFDPKRERFMVTSTRQVWTLGRNLCIAEPTGVVRRFDMDNVRKVRFQLHKRAFFRVKAGYPTDLIITRGDGSEVYAGTFAQYGPTYNHTRGLIFDLGHRLWSVHGRDGVPAPRRVV